MKKMTPFGEGAFAAMCVYTLALVCLFVGFGCESAEEKRGRWSITAEQMHTNVKAHSESRGAPRRSVADGGQYAPYNGKENLIR